MKKDTKYDMLKLENQVCFPIYACAKELVRQYLVMMVLWEKETVSSRELAELLHLDYGTLTPVLKRLDQTGYLIRERSKEDERLLKLTLTKEGEKLKDKAILIPPAIGCCVGLSGEELKVLYTLMYKALGNMEQTGKR